MVHVTCGDCDGKHIDFRKGVDETGHIPQVFLGGFPDFACVGVDDHDSCAKVFISNPFLADQGVIFGIPSAKGEFFRAGFDGVIDKVCGKFDPVGRSVHIATGGAQNIQRIFPVYLHSEVSHQLQCGLMDGIQVFIPKNVVSLDVFFMSEFGHFMLL